jgi:hypothetical protein
MTVSNMQPDREVFAGFPKHFGGKKDANIEN